MRIGPSCASRSGLSLPNGGQQAHAGKGAADPSPLQGLGTFVQDDVAQQHCERAELRRRYAGQRGRADGKGDGEQHYPAQFEKAGSDGTPTEAPGHVDAAGEKGDRQGDEERNAAGDGRPRATALRPGATRPLAARWARWRLPQWRAPTPSG